MRFLIRRGPSKEELDKALFGRRKKKVETLKFEISLDVKGLNKPSIEIELELKSLTRMESDEWFILDFTYTGISLSRSEASNKFLGTLERCEYNIASRKGEFTIR